MARTGPQRIPGARFDLFFGNGRYSGSDMEVNCAALHTTEGASLYDYEDGRSAPSVTALPDFNAQRLLWYQHFDVDESARALVNAPGGVQTNTANVFQIELTGTCDPAAHARWTRAGVQHIYWPEPPDWAIRDLAWLMRWLADNHNIPLAGMPEWLPYPASYGNSRVRMSFDRWRSFTGWCGHQHVPENDHGDPGALPFARILAAAKGETTTPTTPTKPTIPPVEEDIVTPQDIQQIAKAAAEAVWTHPLPNYRADGTPAGTSKEAYWWLVWGDVFQAQLLTAIKAASLTPEQVQRALVDGTLHVELTVKPTATKEN